MNQWWTVGVYRRDGGNFVSITMGWRGETFDLLFFSCYAVSRLSISSFLLFVSNSCSNLSSIDGSWMLWMQQNIWCIVAATFKMTAMRSACSATVLSVVKPKQTRVTGSGCTYPASCEPKPYVIYCPMYAHPPKPPIDSTDVGTTSMSAYKASSKCE